LDGCVFCKIAAGEIPAEKVYDDGQILAFRDIAPQAPTHILVIPREHIESARMIDKSNSRIAARCLEAAAEIAESEGLEGGYRLISNVGADGGQTVFHLHFHLLGGRPLGERLA
jgi:histidine triad (HIT) family protein